MVQQKTKASSEYQKKTERQIQNNINDLNRDIYKLEQLEDKIDNSSFNNLTQQWLNKGQSTKIETIFEYNREMQTIFKKYNLLVNKTLQKENQKLKENNIVLEKYLSQLDQTIKCRKVSKSEPVYKSVNSENGKIHYRQFELVPTNQINKKVYKNITNFTSDNMLKQDTNSAVKLQQLKDKYSPQKTIILSKNDNNNFYLFEGSILKKKNNSEDKKNYIKKIPSKLIGTKKPNNNKQVKTTKDSDKKRNIKTIK